MGTHGTPSVWRTNEEFATVASRVIAALPKALALLNLDPEVVLLNTNEGERLSVALATALRMICVGDYFTSASVKTGPKKIQMSGRAGKPMEAFLLERFKMWYGEDAAKKAVQGLSYETSDSLDYEALSQKIDVGKFGAYTFNPDMQDIDFETAQPIVIDLPQFVGKPRYEAMQYVVDTYGATHHIAGIEYWKWILEHPDKAPQSLKDGEYYFFPGSVLCGEAGRWCLLYAHWHDSVFNSRARWLVNNWDADQGHQVVLLEKDPGT